MYVPRLAAYQVCATSTTRSNISKIPQNSSRDPSIHHHQIKSKRLINLTLAPTPALTSVLIPGAREPAVPAVRTRDAGVERLRLAMPAFQGPFATQDAATSSGPLAHGHPTAPLEDDPHPTNPHLDPETALQNPREGRRQSGGAGP